MFFLNTIPVVCYSDPWNISLQQRLKMLATGKKKVAYFYEQADYGTFRYRAYNMAQVLNASGEDIGISASYFFLSDLAYLNEIADLADVLVICRSRYDNRINHLITAFKKRRKKILFDVDDLIFNVDWLQLILTTIDQPLNEDVFNFWFAYCARVGATLKQCNGAITTNSFLAEQIQDFANLPTAIVPNFLNQEQLDISTQIFAAKKNLSPAQDGFIHIGYFSGTSSHNKDFALVVPAFEMLLEEIPNLCVVIAGYIQADSLVARFGDRVKYLPFTDFINLQRLIGSVEFNIAPLQYNVFTNCKSELKYFEAAIVGTPTIASPTFTFSQAIRHQDNGYIAQAHQWYSTIKQAVNDIDDYQKMADRSHAHAQDYYAWYNQKQVIIKALM
ncbi:MAG: glycosyltransferase [Gammaproteobacteria bacterium]|jgi:glycosyltransferase involved in cell wall biosynthesis